MRRIFVEGYRIVPGLEGFYTRLQELQTERSRLTASRFGYTRDGPTVQVLDSLIAGTQQDIRAITEQTLAATRTRLRAADTRVAELRAQQSVLPAQASVFLRLQQRVDAAQQTFDQLAEKYYEAQIAEAVQTGNVEIIDAATIPTLPVASLRRRLPAIAGVLGLLFGVALVFIAELMNRKVRTPAEAEQATELSVLAAIPTQKPGRRSGPRTLVHTGATGESFRILRTSVDMSWQKPPGLIAVTSPAPAEGKSFVSVGLADAIAQKGKRVLLIDADLRRPTLHSLLELPQEPGLADVLLGQATLQDVVRPLEHGRLSLLTCGALPSNPAELLASSGFEQLLASARSEFDAVVVDTPPVLLVGESAALVRLVDAIILIARAERTDRAALEFAAARLRQVKAPLLGVVLNGIPRVGRFGRYGNHYGYYGYRYSEYYGAGKAGSRPAVAARSGNT